MINKGFIHADVHYAIDTSERKKATVRYVITAGEPYRIQNRTDMRCSSLKAGAFPDDGFC